MSLQGVKEILSSRPGEVYEATCDCECACHALGTKMAPVSCLLLMATQVREADAVGKGMHVVSGVIQCPHSYLAITDTEVFRRVPIFTSMLFCGCS